jgi:PEP-CTERM motif
MTQKAILTIFATLAMGAGAQAQIVYSNDFETTTGGFSNGALVSHPITANPLGATSKFLGLFSDNTATQLTLTGLTPGSVYDLTLDLLIRGSWDGNSPTVGPDVWRVKAGGSTVVDTTFSNVTGSSQSFSRNGYIGGPGNFAPGTDASVNNSNPDVFSRYTIYKFDKIALPQIEFTPATSSLVITFEGANLQGVADESWALDNVKVTGRGSAIPEPGTLALVGLGALALLRRRRK